MAPAHAHTPARTSLHACTRTPAHTHTHTHTNTHIAFLLVEPNRDALRRFYTLVVGALPDGAFDDTEPHSDLLNATVKAALIAYTRAHSSPTGTEAVTPCKRRAPASSDEGSDDKASGVGRQTADRDAYRKLAKAPLYTEAYRTAYTVYSPTHQ